MRNIAPILLAAVCLALCALASHAATPPQNIRVLGCTQGGGTYAVVNPGVSVSMNVSQNPSGSPSLCGVPTNYPQDYYVKTTVDGGKTWQWTYRIIDFAFTVPVTPPVTPPPTTTTTVSVPPQVWTCSSDNTTVTCTSPVVPGATP